MVQRSCFFPSCGVSPRVQNLLLCILASSLRMVQMILTVLTLHCIFLLLRHSFLTDQSFFSYFLTLCVISRNIFHNLKHSPACIHSRASPFNHHQIFSALLTWSNSDPFTFTCWNSVHGLFQSITLVLVKACHFRVVRFSYRPAFVSSLFLLNYSLVSHESLFSLMCPKQHSQKSQSSNIFDDTGTITFLLLPWI